LPIAPLHRAALVALAVTLGLTAIGALGPAAGPAGAGSPDFCDTTANRTFVCDSYVSFFRREPTTGEVDHWAARVPAQKAFFLASLGKAAESKRRTIEAYYSYFAGSEVDEASLAYWEGEVLKTHGLRRLEAALLASVMGVTTDDFVELAYDRLLAHQPTNEELTYWGTRVSQVGKNLVAADIAYTIEARRTRVRWAYSNELGYVPDDAGRDYWAERLRTGTSYLEMRIGLKGAPDGYPDGSRFCSAPAPILTYGCAI
jgi:hypothetical protein